MLQSKKWLQSTKRSNIKNPLEIFEVRIQMPPLELKRGVSRPTSTSEELIICTRERPCGHLTVEKAHDSTADNRFLPKGQLLSCWSQVWSTPMLLAVDIFYLMFDVYTEMQYFPCQLALWQDKSITPIRIPPSTIYNLPPPLSTFDIV